MALATAIKKLALNVLALGPTSRGFTGEEARNWVGSVCRHYLKRSGYSFRQSRWAIQRGFMPEQVENLGLTQENYKETISAREYAFLQPLNGGYSKWISDRITINSVFKPYLDKLPGCYYQIYKRYKETLIIPLQDRLAGDSFTDILNLLKEKGNLQVRQAEGDRHSLIQWTEETFFFDHKPCSEEEMIKKLSSFQETLVVTEDVTARAEFAGARVCLTVFNAQGDDPKIGDAYIFFEELKDLEKPLTKGDKSGSRSKLDDLATEKGKIYAHIDSRNGRISPAAYICRGKRMSRSENPNNGLPIATGIPFWEEIVRTVTEICLFAPQLEFFGIEVAICEDGFKIMDMINRPPYPQVVPFNRAITEYLRYKAKQKQEAYHSPGVRRKRAIKKIKGQIRRLIAKLFFPKGLVPYLSIRWIRDQKKDFLTNRDTTIKEKLWAVRHGFLSYRIHQYGITRENYTRFISDFEYRWLRHINNEYRKWMEDKITVKYICSDYNACFPEYYYHISLKNGSNKVISMMDCPKGYENTYEEIFRLVREKGDLALKPDEGSHGDGFYKFSYENGTYYLNHQEASEADVLEILKNVSNQYLVTEYINMHPEIKRIYDGAVNTIRMIVFKKDGKNPVIGNAYMRFGSKRTGAVDNMGAGGMFARIDIETGKFYDAKIIEANEIKPCLYHPDTGVKIEGYLPNWEKVKRQVLDVARNIPQLEYFGFDLALTKDGLKFPEINRFPDYPAIEKYTPQTIDYLLYKLAKKKELYGYDKSRGHKLVKLPKR